MYQRLFIPIIFIISFYFASTTRISISIVRRGKTLRPVSALCIKEGRGWAYYNQTKACHKIGEQGPCETMMKFSQNDTAPNYGYCSCDFYKQCGRPVVSWNETSKCYFVNEQGPCPKDQWLTLKSDKTPTCTPNICQVEESKMPSQGSKFWFAENGTCYQTQTRGYCENENALLLFKSQDSKPTCNFGLVCGSTTELSKLLKSQFWKLNPQQNNSASGELLYSGANSK